MTDPYCYKVTNVLKNKFHIRDPKELERYECFYTVIRQAELYQKGITGAFDLKHLTAIHKYIFQDLYSWAGKLRTVDIAKGNMFCPVQNITAYAYHVFNSLKKEKFLSQTPYINLAERMASYFGDINALHPFREGNGRAQRLFFKQLAEYNHCKLDLTQCSPERMVSASRASFMGKEDEMIKIFQDFLIMPSGRVQKFGPRQ